MDISYRKPQGKLMTRLVLLQFPVLSSSLRVHTIMLCKQQTFKRLQYWPKLVCWQRDIRLSASLNKHRIICMIIIIIIIQPSFWHNYTQCSIHQGIEQTYVCNPRFYYLRPNFNISLNCYTVCHKFFLSLFLCPIPTMTSISVEYHKYQ